MSNPYDSLPSKSFWKPAVGGINPLETEGLWTAKYGIQKSEKVITAGSCFAQHIGRALAKNGFNWHNAEPGTGNAALDKKYGYGVFSFRTGNIYTAALLRQWMDLAFSRREPIEEFWEKDGRYFDPLRPAIEPNGFSSLTEMQAAREVTLGAIRSAITDAGVFVFTLGLTEAWINTTDSFVYAMCPGTLAGVFDQDQHKFHNFTYPEIVDDLSYCIELAREINPGIRFLLTVSPVPLTATATGDHVLVSSTYSKSTLRAVAGDVSRTRSYVDYFPSYEIIVSPNFRGFFYQPNMREVSGRGVDFVMTHFFAGLAGKAGASVTNSPAGATARPKDSDSASSEEDVSCEDAMLEAFGERS